MLYFLGLMVVSWLARMAEFIFIEWNSFRVSVTSFKQKLCYKHSLLLLHVYDVRKHVQ